MLLLFGIKKNIKIPIIVLICIISTVADWGYIGVLWILIFGTNHGNFKIKSSLNQLGVNNIHFEKNIEDWSEGQKKKLLIASSLCEPAKLYIWDEPLNFIDVISRIQIQKMIIEENPTMLFVEHDKCFGEAIASKIIDI